MTGRELFAHWMRNNPRFREAMRELDQDGVVLPGEAVRNVTRPTLIVCGTHHQGLIGARQARCGCNALIWLSPPTQDLVVHNPDMVFPMCPACAERALSGEVHA